MKEGGRRRTQARHNGSQEEACDEINPEEIGDFLAGDIRPLNRDAAQSEVAKDDKKRQQWRDHRHQSEIGRREKAAEHRRRAQLKQDLHRLAREGDRASSADERSRSLRLIQPWFAHAADLLLTLARDSQKGKAHAGSSRSQLPSSRAYSNGNNGQRALRTD